MTTTLTIQPPTCHTPDCRNPRRRRGDGFDVMCEGCYQAALAEVIAELEHDEAPEEARRRYRRSGSKGPRKPPKTTQPTRVAPVLRVDAQLARASQDTPARARS